MKTYVSGTYFLELNSNGKIYHLTIIKKVMFQILKILKEPVVQDGSLIFQTKNLKFLKF